MVLLPGCGCCGPPPEPYECYPLSDSPELPNPMVAVFAASTMSWGGNGVYCGEWPAGSDCDPNMDLSILENCPTPEQCAAEWGVDEKLTSSDPFVLTPDQGRTGARYGSGFAEYQKCQTPATADDETVEYWKFRLSYCINNTLDSQPNYFSPSAALWKKTSMPSFIVPVPEFDCSNGLLPGELGPFVYKESCSQIQYSIQPQGIDYAELSMENYLDFIDGIHIVNSNIRAFKTIETFLTYENDRGVTAIIDAFRVSGFVQGNPASYFYCE